MKHVSLQLTATNEAGETKTAKASVPAIFSSFLTISFVITLIKTFGSKEAVRLMRDVNANLNNEKI